MKIDLVLGLGFGDEGKGNTVNALASEDSLVVRFNGGQQAGHTVYDGKKKHVFASFGSGTLKGASTYISEFCTVSPSALINEWHTLRLGNYKPKLFIDANAMITTPFDIIASKKREQMTKNGSCGMGIGTTMNREKAHYKLRMIDLTNSKVLEAKYKLIKKYYLELTEFDQRDLDFVQDCKNLVKKSTIVNHIKQIPNFYKHIIFEGAQGIMLDMDYGFFPHVTYSNTTSKNAFALLKGWGLHAPAILEKIDTYYITRAYQTRHGNGPMTNELLDNSFISISPDETNKDEGIQGIFRYSMLDLDLLKHAMSVDSLFNKTENKKLVMTCLDQVNFKNESTFASSQGNFNIYSPQAIAEKLGIFDKVIMSNSPELII